MRVITELEDLLGRGNAYLKVANFDRAEVYFRKAVFNHPDSIEALCSQGLALFNLQKLEATLACYEKILEIDPYHEKALINRGVVYLAMGDIDSALLSYQLVVEFLPNSVDGHCRLNELLLNTNTLESYFVETTASFDHPECDWEYLSAFCQGWLGALLILGQYDRGRALVNLLSQHQPTWDWLSYQRLPLEISHDINFRLGTNTEKIVLHVGCGPYHPELLHIAFRYPHWKEIRLDINPAVSPDIIGTLTDMHAVPPSFVDAVWSSHNVEHLYRHEVPIALNEFYRVLKPGGVALITLPNIQEVARQVAEGNLEDTLYVSPAGPIAAIDVLYGLSTDIAKGNYYMAHKTAFTAQTLTQKLQEASFMDVEVTIEGLNLWAKAYKPIQ